MEVFLNYLPKSYATPEGVSKESYFLGIAGGLPLKHCTFPVITISLVFASSLFPEDKKVSKSNFIEEKDEYSEKESAIEGMPDEVSEINEDYDSESMVVEANKPPQQFGSESITLEVSKPPEDYGLDSMVVEAKKPPQKFGSESIALEVSKPPEEYELEAKNSPKEVMAVPEKPYEENSVNEENDFMQDTKNLNDALQPVPEKEEPKYPTPAFRPTFSIEVGKIDLPPTPRTQTRIVFDSAPPSDIEAILKETEELLLMYNVQGGSPNRIQKELSHRFYDNMERVVAILSNTLGPPKATEQVLVRIAEIGKKYVEGPLQARLLRAVLEEYRKVQEDKIRKLEQEKESLETTQQSSEKHDILQALLTVFPEDILKEIDELKGTFSKNSEIGTGAESRISNSPPVRSIKTSRQQSESKLHSEEKPSVRKTGKQPRETPKQRLIQTQGLKFKNTAWDVKRRVTPKAGDINFKKGKTMGTRKQNVKVSRREEDAWIGLKSVELENDELWEKDVI